MKKSKNPVLLALSLALALCKPAFAADDSDDDYDRLDGQGASGKKVHVVEWEGNLEIHVYPQGSLKGLSLKLDKRDKSKPVMVIGYRFEDGKRLIRRAILGIDLKEGFKAFRDPSADDYDKIVISNNTLSGEMAFYKLDPAPAQLYPDGHPDNEPASASSKVATKKPDRARKPASAVQPKRAPADDSEEDSDIAKNAPAAPSADEAGTIQPFFMKAQGARRDRIVREKP